MNISKLFVTAGLCSLVACSGGGDGGSNDDDNDRDTEAPVLEMLFPPTGQTFLVQGDDLGNPDRFHLRGTVNADAGEVSFLLNDDSVDSDADFPDWATFSDLSFGLNTLTISARDASGNSSAPISASVINEGLFMRNAHNVMFDSANNRLLIIETRQHRVIELDLSNNQRRIIKRTIGASQVPILVTSFPTVSAYSSFGNQIYYVEKLLAEGLVTYLYDLRRVDLDDGTDELVSGFHDFGPGVGPEISDVIGIALDSANTVYVLGKVSLSSAIVAVNLSSGNRSVIASASVGTGLAYPETAAIAWNSINGRLLGISSAGQLYDIDVSDDNNRTLLSDEGVLGTGPDFSDVNPSSLVHDSREGHVLFIANNESNPSANRTLFSINTGDGSRAVVSETETAGSGIGFDEGVGSLAIDPDEQKVYAVATDLYSALEIDIASGDRHLLSSSLGSGPELIRPARGRHDSSGRRLLITDRLLNGLYAIDVDTGNRSLLSGGVTGTGVAFEEPVAVDFNSARTTAFVLDAALDSVFAVDLATGNRTIISGGGAGFNLQDPVDMVLDSDNGRLLVADYGADTVVAIDLSDGARSNVMDDLAVAAARGPLAIEIDPANDRAFIAVDDEMGSTVLGKIVELNLNTDVPADLTTLAQAEDDGLYFEDLAMRPDGDALYAIHQYQGVILTTVDRKVFTIDLETRQIMPEQNLQGHEFTNNRISAIETGSLENSLYIFDERSGAAMLMEVKLVDEPPLTFNFEGVVFSR